HNSYHLRTGETTIGEWNCEHASHGEEMTTQGVRTVELDVHWDAELKRYRVYHVGLFDPSSTSDLLLDCLVELRVFSDAHPGHHPIFVQIEPKGSNEPLSPAELGDRLVAEIRAVFPEELLVTLDLVRARMPTLAEAIATRGWPTVA